MEYSTSDIVHWEPADLPQLTDLILSGTPALSFHPETLRATPSLQHLKLAMPTEDGISYIPPLTESEESSDIPPTDNIPATSPRQPIWSWDWDLPKLTTLILTAEFGYRFQFKMLGGTPSLVEFSLDIRSSSFDHERTITIKDLANNNPRELSTIDVLGDYFADEFSLSDYVYLPHLQRLTLNGSWILNSEVLNVLFKSVAPNVAHLMFLGCDGFGVVDWVKITSSYLKRLREATASIHVSPELALEAGIVNTRMYAMNVGFCHLVRDQNKNEVDRIRYYFHL
jgi:hypothetical protein